ncbi:MAG: hypothetical protein ACFFBD_04320 [Candidatus Hodarchaeota archaeon]
MEIDSDLLFKCPQSLKIPNFSKQEAIVNSPSCYPPPNMSVYEWWQDFCDRFFYALDNNIRFPVFRSGHGEFSFVLGQRDKPKQLKKLFRFSLSRIYRTLYFQSVFYSGTPKYGYETYKQWHLPALKRDFVKYLKWISINGVLSMYFADRDAYSIGTQKAYIEWLYKNGIELTKKNYSHVYFIYGLFHGPKVERIFNGKKILIVSSDQDERTNCLENNLFKIGANDFRIIPISRNQSLKDKIKVPYDYNPDLCLIGAGVGASKMIYTMRKLNCPIIDVGYVIDTLAYPEMKKNRIYCVNDEIWEKFFPNNNPPYKEKFSEKGN